jgi:tRNA(adenine34) deaminase
VRHVYYGATDPKAGVITLGINLHANPALNHRYKMICLTTPECSTILSDFFHARRKSKKP